MKKLLFRTLLVAMGIMAIVGCRTAPIYNVEDAAIVSSTNKRLTMEQVKTAIIRGGVNRGWAMKAAGNGLVIGTLHLRGTQSVVEIKYNTKSYSITHKDSQGLGYNGESIHRRYNTWVQNLQTSITNEISLM